MFRALKHVGVATEAFFEVAAGERKLTSEQRARIWAACAVLAESLRVMRGGKG